MGPAVCMRALISLIDRLLEDFEHREEAELLAPTALCPGSGAFVDPTSFGDCFSMHYAWRTFLSENISERKRGGPPASPVLICGLPCWGGRGRRSPNIVAPLGGMPLIVSP